MFCNRAQRCQITEYRSVQLQRLFHIQVLVNDILVGLERILVIVHVRLERFNCNQLTYSKRYLATFTT